MANEKLNRAKEFFADSKNEGVDKVYFTKDGNMFRAKHYAENWGGVGNVETVYRQVVEALDAKLKKNDEKGEKDISSLQLVKTESNEPETEKDPAGEKDPLDSKEDEDGKEPEADKEPAKPEVTEADEKEALVKRYIELYDTKPNHMTGIVKLKEKIAAKEAENAKAGLED